MRAVLISFLALVSGMSQADTSLIYPQQAQCKSNVLALQISGSKTRYDSLSENQPYSMLFDGTEDIITTLDHANRRYHQVEVDEDALDYNKDVMSSAGTYIGNQMQGLQAQMKEQCAEMEKQGINCPDMDLSSIMQNAQAMTNQQASKMELRLSETTNTVAGMPCKTFDRYENDNKESQECYVEPKNMVMSDSDKKYFLRNMKVMTHYALSFAGLSEKLSNVDKQAPAQSDPADKDILLSKICFAPDGSEVGRIEVQVSNAAIDEASFDIPAGYQVMSITQ